MVLFEELGSLGNRLVQREIFKIGAAKCSENFDAPAHFGKDSAKIFGDLSGAETE